MNTNSTEIPEQEKKRLEALRRYEILDSESERIYDDLAKLASYICSMPISLVSLVDADRQWSKAHYGIPGGEVPREIAFCSHAIEQDEILVVNDATKDQRFSHNPLVVNSPQLRFYAGAPLKAPCGSRLGTLCVIDMKPRQLTEDQLVALSMLSRQVIDQFELRVAHKKLQIDTELIQQLCEKKDHVLYALSHDLKGSLTSIVGLSEVLIECIHSGSTDKILNMAQLVQESGESSVKLLNSVLQWAMAQDKDSHFLPTRIHLKDVIFEVLDLVKVHFRPKSHVFKVNCPDNVHLLGDKHMLFSVFQNLLTNACKYTPESGTVSLSVSYIEGNARITVSDTGKGMNQNQLQKILNGERSISMPGTDGERGTGFGMMLCRQFIEKHNGRLEVKSQLGQGTQFQITFPFSEQTQEEGIRKIENRPC